MNNNDQPVNMEEMKNSEMGIFLKALMIEVFDERLEKALKKSNVQSDNPVLYEIKDICAIFKITPQTFHNWRNRGWITGRKLVRADFLQLRNLTRQWLTTKSQKEEHLTEF